jgi:hypothetical protein
LNATACNAPVPRLFTLGYVRAGFLLLGGCKSPSCEMTIGKCVAGFLRLDHLNGERCLGRQDLTLARHTIWRWERGRQALQVVD